MIGPNLSEWSLGHRALMVYFMILAVVAGCFAYFHLGRNEDPSFTIKVMVIEAALPGATIDETLLQLTDRIEKKLQETPGLDNIRSYTVAGRATVFVTLKGSVGKTQVPDIWYQVRKKIGDIQSSFPQGTYGPYFNDEFGDTFGIVYAFTADGFSHRELRDYTETVRERLLRVKDVAKVIGIGTQDERIYIEFSPELLSKFNLDRGQIVAALQSQNAIEPSGTVSTALDKVQVQVSGKFTSEKDFADIFFMVGGKRLRLGDIATISRGYADPPQPRYRVNGKDAIGLAVSMAEGGDILALEENLKAAMAELGADMPVGIEAHLVADQPKVVHEAVDEFMKSLFEAVAIVMAVSFVSLGLRAGTVVALSIPVVLALVFVGMQMAGIDFQRVSLGALIISLGLLVDDAMITVESMVSRLELGWDKLRAATFAYTSTAFPMLTGTLVTMIGFVPIGFAKSDAGEYTFSLFAVVSIALLISWFVAVLFAPLIGVRLLKEHGPAGKAHGGRLMGLFKAFLLAAMRRAKTTVALTVALFLASLAAVPLIPNQFFPSSDRPELLVDLTLPQNASIYATDEVSRRLDALLAGDPDIDHWTSYVGRGAIRFYLPLDEQLPNDFFAQTVIVTKSNEARERVAKRLGTALEDGFPEIMARVSALELGPPVGWPVQYRVSGPDPRQVRDIAQKVAELMAKSPDLQKITFNWGEPVRTLRFSVSQERARQLGLSSAAIAQAINMVVSGSTVTQVRDSIYLIDVVMRADQESRQSLESLRALRIPLPNGQTAPLAELAGIENTQDFPLIWRRDRAPSLTVQADINGAVLPATAVDNLAGRMAELNRALPAGYAVEVGGTVEESAKSQASVAAVMPVMLLMMVTVLMIQLQDFRHLLLVVSVAPLGLIGVVAALLVTGQPLGFVALLGIVALIGMIVRNSVILVHQIEVEIAAGLAVWNAVVEATLLRFRPIMLTAVAAILGMVPIAPTVFWGPMASAIMGGLLVATVLTLVFLPALYVACLRVREPAA